MPGDYTRFSFDPAKDYAGVRMQQGKVMLDADWNELVDALDHRTRAESIDTIGRCAVPRETPEGFLVSIEEGAVLIGPGRAYVDGLLAENHGVGDLTQDPSLEELRGAEPMRYDDQPYRKDSPAAPQGDVLFYLDVFRREVTAAEEPRLRDPAIGFDTATRTQTAWQVRAHPLEGGGFDCETKLEEVPGWLDENAPSAGRLTTTAVGAPATDDPCELPPSGGYRGIENRLYRVEVHDGGKLGEATFKWSRDNASLTVAVEAIESLRTLTVDSAGRDETVRFESGDWVEVLDDRLELQGLPGVLRKVATVNAAAGTVELVEPLPGGTFGGDEKTLKELNTRLRRWDQAGEVLAPDGARIADVDVGGGSIVVPTGEVLLEDGVVVSFSTASDEGRFRRGDHWCFAARTADGSVEPLSEAPPRGVHHHYCPLAIREGGALHDCRTLWPPAEVCCACTVCVSAESHASGELTVQRAIDEVARTGGTVCLGPGEFRLTTPLAIRRVRSLRIVGQGAAATRIVATGTAAAFVETCSEIEIEDLGIVTLGAVGVGLRNVIGASLRRCAIEAVGRDVRAILAERIPLIGKLPLGGIAVGLAGVIAGASIRECRIKAGPMGTAIGKLGFVRADLALERPALQSALEWQATAGIAPALVGVRQLRPVASPTPSAAELRTARAFRPRESFAATAANTQQLGAVLAVDLVVEGCHLSGRHGIALGGFNLLGGQTRLSANVVRSLASGIALAGSTLPEQVAAALGATGAEGVAAEAGAPGPAQAIVDRNFVSFGFGEGIVVGVEMAQVSDNNLAGVGTERAFAGAAVAAIGAGPDHSAESLRVAGNRIVDAPRAAVSVACEVRDLDVSGNLVSRPGRVGIAMEDEASADAALVEANQLRDVAPELNEQKSEPAGIRLVAARRAVVVGNAVSRVATRATDEAQRRGIQVIGASAVRIADNTLVGIGPLSSFAGTAVGIDVLSGAGRVDVSGNEVSRAEGTTLGAAGSEWQALRLGDPVFASIPLSELDLGLIQFPSFGFFAFSNPLSYFLLADDVRVLVSGLTLIYLPQLPEEITVRGNHLHATGRVPAALVNTEGTCVFSENHVHRSGERDAPAALLRAGTLIVQGNSASTPRGSAISLIATKDTFTALGNVSSDGILLKGAQLPDPWRPLNASV